MRVNAWTADPPIVVLRLLLAIELVNSMQAVF